MSIDQTVQTFTLFLGIEIGLEYLLREEWLVQVFALERRLRCGRGSVFI